MPTLSMFICAAAIFGCATAAVATGASAAESYKIDVVLPLTGGAAFLGRGEQQALQVFQTTANKEGGVNGQPLEFIYHDDQTSPQTTVQITNGILAAILATSYGWPPLAAVLVAIILCVFCALVLSLATVQLRGHYLALATLAFGLLVDSVATGLVDVTGGPSGLVGIPAFSVAGFDFDTPLRMYYLALTLSVVLVFLLEGGMRSDFGRALKAVRSDQLAAAALGINVGRIKVVALCISAALAGLSGGLYAFNFHFLSPDMVSTTRSFELIAMLVLGGEGTLIGGLFGSVALTVLPTLVQEFAIFKTAVEGAVLIAIFLFMPEGLFGRLSALLDRALSQRSKLARIGADL